MMKLKKPKFWDYEKPNLLSYLLLPFTFPLIINNFFLNLKKKINLIQTLNQSALEIFILVEQQKHH